MTKVNFYVYFYVYELFRLSIDNNIDKHRDTMKKIVELFIFIMLVLPLGGCKTQQLSNISSNYNLNKESNKCIVIGKIDISAKHTIGITSSRWMEIKKASGESIPSLPVGEYFFVSMEPGDYIIEKTWIGMGLLGALGYNNPATVNVKFNARSNDIIYIGNLKVIHNLQQGGPGGFDKEITDDYETATREFRSRYPNIQGVVKRYLME